MSEAELRGLFHELDRQRRLVEAALASVIAEVDRSGAYRVDGHASVSGWVRALGRWSNAEVVHRRRVAALAAECEAFAAALASGAIGVAQSHELARAAANPRCGDELPADIDAFVSRADRCSYAEFRERIDGWLITHDVDGAHRDREWGHEQRDAWMTVFDGVGHGGFTGGAADVTELKEIFDRFCEAEFAADWEATVARLGEAASIGDLPRTDAQRRFDAFVAVFRRGASQEPEACAAPPLVNLVVDVHTLDEFLHDEPTLAAPQDPWRRRCHTTNGAPVAPAETLAAMWWGQVRAAIVDGAGVVVAMGRRRRLFTGAARDAVLMASSRCVWPGCLRPAGRCQADHLQEWSRHNGATDSANGAPMCGRHNRWKSTGYTTFRARDGTWHTVRPDGTELC
jgi:hypothetical protein